jgi:ribosome-associated protein
MDHQIDIRKLQRAIVDGLEDVKAHDIRVFNTEHLSPASSVRETVKSRGLAMPRMEGEDNGEWIIVDCGAAVAHIMQPAIRQYYNLEEIWGEKAVKMKSAAPAKKKTVAKKATPKKTTAAKKTPAKKAPAKKTAAARRRA